MPAILVITNQTAEMQPDAIEATQFGRYRVAAFGPQFVINSHILFLTKSKRVPYREWD